MISEKLRNLPTPAKILLGTYALWALPNLVIGGGGIIAEHLDSEDAEISTCSQSDNEAGIPLGPRDINTLLTQANSPVDRGLGERSLSAAKVIAAPGLIAETFDPVNGVGENICYDSKTGQMLLTAAGENASKRTVPPLSLLPTN